MDPIAVAALEAFRAALAKSRGRRPAFLQLLWPDGKIDTYSLDGMMAGNTASEKSTPVPIQLSDREKTVMEAMEKIDRPLKGAAVARRAKLSYNPNFRRLMSGLMQKGLIIPGPQGGYWLASRPLPEAEDV